MLNINNIRLFDIALQIAHFQVGKGKRPFPVGNNPAQTAAKEVKAPSDRLNEVGIEAVEADEFFVLEFCRLVDLLAEQDGARFLAVEEDEPVAAQSFLLGADEIDLAAILRDCPAAPDAHRIEVLGKIHVARPVGKKVFEVLERRDQLALAHFGGDILDRVADRQHRLGVHNMMEIAVGDGDDIAEPDFLAGTSMMHADGFAASVEMMMIRLELGLEAFVRGVLAIRFG